MAIWQKDLELVIRDGSLFAADKKLSFDEISGIFRKKQYTEKLFIYGEEDNTCIHIAFSENFGYEILLRIDLRSCTKKEANAIIKFCITNNLYFTENGIIYEPSIKNLTQIIKDSPEKKFIDNPIEFLDGLSKSKTEEQIP